MTETKTILLQVILLLTISSISYSFPIIVPTATTSSIATATGVGLSTRGYYKPNVIPSTMITRMNSISPTATTTSSLTSTSSSSSSSSSVEETTNIIPKETDSIAEEKPMITPKAQYDSLICGGGPAGLLAAIMLTQKFGPLHRIAVCENRPAIPLSPSNKEIWNDVARFYLLGIGFRGQRALEKFGVLDDFIKASVAVNGRRDWAPGKTNVEDGNITPSKKDVTSRVLARDKLVGVLYYHILENYSNANIDLLYGYQVEPISFGTDEDDFVKVKISKCIDNEEQQQSQDSNEECDIDSSPQQVTTKLLIGADGKLFAPKPFRVKRYVDDNARVFKSVRIQLPSDWPCDLNYSARSSDSRITLEALPSDANGNLCALLLMKPDDELAKENADPKTLRAFFDKEFPQFGTLINDDEMEQVATKSASSLPAFRYAGPRLTMKRRTLVLGDAAHTVKPYFGLGANSAMEDIGMLSDALDEAAAAVEENDNNEEENIVPKALQLFSNRRSGDSEALVMMSRNMDRPGKMFFITFVLPIILDGMFHKIAPKIFGPNMFGMFQRQDIGFKQIQRKKRLDRTLQVAIIASVLTATGVGIKSAIRLLAKSIGTSQIVVTASIAVTCAIGIILKKTVEKKGIRELIES
ncbi:FAD/NAD(P)-binding domain-containing protein [Fragilariopsis cylindrus CCMP1102]|uniref:FAD/NAD(P)-binding domain-containing protein n=1 Tax=Fragilariopsis cylindrus CCMP1102 TaxID=635003 RepID=A0A1E7FFU8_9STRA|nr:FAD/NAD(P)-binding domain-containing protein [Fragilariopsis cylindrus CCMP1102]|eukprot:OEU17016.1 FAD/NAD(P)-binding domain-containing protein [Fragilariopsis cylindrus CCMP1102]